MNRRGFIAAVDGAAAWPVVARAQQFSSARQRLPQLLERAKRVYVYS
jgi:hypothetical protein